MFFIGQPVKESRVTGDSHNLTVQTFDVTSCFGGMNFFQRPAGKGIVMKGNITVLIIIVWNDICQFGTSVSSECTACSGIAHCWHGSLRSAGVVETFTFYIHIGSMRIPVHGKTRQEPVRLRLCQAGIGISLCFQLTEYIFCP